MNNENRILIWMQTRPKLTNPKLEFGDNFIIKTIQHDNKIQTLKRIIEYYNYGIDIDEEKSEFTIWVPNPSGMYVVDTYNHWYRDTNTDIEDMIPGANFMIIEYDREKECIVDALEISKSRPTKYINDDDIPRKIDGSPILITKNGNRYLVSKHYEPMIQLTFKGNFTRDECVRNNAEVYVKITKQFMKEVSTTVEPSPMFESKEEPVNESNR